MPRGIPNAKRDETGLRYTTFNVPLAPNPKHVSSTYLKSESQTLWARNAARKSKASATDEAAPLPEPRRGSNVIVIHLGSRFLRIGRASDVTPISVLNVVARKCKQPVSAPGYGERILRPRKWKTGSVAGNNGDEYDVTPSSDDPFDAKITAITVSLRDRMRFYKLRVTHNATNIASTFNEQFKPEIIAEHNDPYHVDWIDETSTEGVIVGEKVALNIADPEKSGYQVKWPIYGSNFNTRDYASLQAILADIETVIRTTLYESHRIDSHDIKNYSVLLVIPDLYERTYVRELINLILSMGFKQFCVQQESLAATYGAGISNACVVDIGATTTSIACVDEGLVLADTRMCLHSGGDDITEFLYVLLERINFPYKTINLSRSYDWKVMEDLKARLCTLAEGDVALNLYDFVVRQPKKSTEKYGLRAYDEIILAPMCIFEPRVIDFDNKRAGFKPISPNVTEDILNHQLDFVTKAMTISTQHLMPAAADTTVNKTQESTTTIRGSSSPSKFDQDLQSGPLDGAGDTVQADLPTEAMVEAIEGEEDSKTPLPQSRPKTPPAAQPQSPPADPSAFSIDVCFEASKLPLDVAIFNSARAAGGDEKIRKYLQAVLVVGGSALIPGMDHALESRLQAIATPLVANMEKVQIIPPPKEVDPRVLTWKGAAVLGKMDGVSELWITAADWEVLGMRGLKERCFYL